MPKIFGNDEERFRSERNRLGGLLLLKGKDNISSNNEPYTDKLISYANTLYWNETLRADSYKSHLDFTNWINVSKLNFRPMDKFGPDELEERQRLLFEIVKFLDDSCTRATAAAERAFLCVVEGGCQVPIGVYATTENNNLNIEAIIASIDGKNFIRDKIIGSIDDAERLGETLERM